MVAGAVAEAARLLRPELIPLLPLPPRLVMQCVHAEDVAEHRRERILRAAIAEFSRNGLAGARTEAIAAGAGVNKALLYYYFGSKHDLYRAVLEHLLEEFRRTIGPADSPPHSSRARLIDFVNRYFDFLASHPNFPRLMQREVTESKGELDWILRDYYRPLLSGVVALIEAGEAAKAEKQGEDKQAASSPQMPVSPPVAPSPAKPAEPPAPQLDLDRGEQVVGRLLQHHLHERELVAELPGDHVELGVDMLVVGLREDRADQRGDHLAVPMVGC